MFCLKCGEEIKPGNRFCTKCGETTPEVSVQPQPSKAIGPAVSTRKLTRNKILRIVGAILILISLFLPFSSLGTASLWSIVTPFLWSITGVTDMVPISFVMMATGFVLLLIGGIVAFFRALIGAILAILAIVFLSATIHMTLGRFVWIGAMGLGYYLAWLGVIISIIASIFEIRASGSKFGFRK
ncbi:MAG: zinc-ribbon domain-containing protein [Candidatus Bathyarchaeia archaeon]